MKRLLPVLMAAILSFSVSANCGERSPQPKIYAVKYGESLFPAQYIFYGDRSSKQLEFTWLFYYIEYKDKRILIDTGFDNRKFIKMFSINGYTMPSAILEKNGIRPESITDIILTHCHFDHAGGISNYPSARIYISSPELDLVKKGKYGQELRDLLTRRENIISFDETYNLQGIFTIKLSGSHTPGSSAVYLDTSDSKYCFTGDEVYSRMNLTEKRASGSSCDMEKNMKFINQYDPAYIPLTLHDAAYYGSKENYIIIENP